jgi:predicted amidohydrolase
MTQLSPGERITPPGDAAGDVVVAAVQLCSTDDVARNLARVNALGTEAARAGARLVALPENFAYLGGDRDHKVSIAEVIPGMPGDAGSSSGPAGPILAAMQDLARGAGVWLLLGGFPERVANDDRRIHNTSVLLDPEGHPRAAYRKLHLFDVDVPGGRRFRESDDVVPGTQAVVAETPWGALGLAICYDVRFPELFRQHAARGARFVTVPSAFTLQTGKDHWHLLLRARAVENLMYVIAPAQWGQHGGGRASYGHALIVDPWGTVIADCGDHEGFALARLDLGYQDRVRAHLPCLAHRRL